MYHALHLILCFTDETPCQGMQAILTYPKRLDFVAHDIEGSHVIAVRGDGLQYAKLWQRCGPQVSEASGRASYLKSILSQENKFDLIDLITA